MQKENSDKIDQNKNTKLLNMNGIKTTKSKVMLSIIAASVLALFTYGVTTMQPSLAQIPGITPPQDQQEASGDGGTNPTLGYDIHVTVNRHDSLNLNAPMDHYCKLDKRILAVCLLYAKDNNFKPGTGPQLSQVEFIITKDQ